jgi:hypothetical protein
MKLVLFLVVVQFPGIFVRVTMLMAVLQFQFVFINDIHGVVVLHHRFGINHYALQLPLLMELPCLENLP